MSTAKTLPSSRTQRTGPLRRMDDGWGFSALSVAKSKFMRSTENGRRYRLHGILLVVEEETWRVILFYVRKVRSERRKAHEKEIIKRIWDQPSSAFRPRCE